MNGYICVTKAKPYLLDKRQQGRKFEIKTKGELNKENDDLPCRWPSSVASKERERQIKTALNGLVVASFELSKIQELDFVVDEGTYNFYIADGCPMSEIKKILKESCLSDDELISYGGGRALFAWHIDGLEILKDPLKTANFAVRDGNGSFKRMPRAPQSYCHVYGTYSSDGSLILFEDGPRIFLSVQPQWACKILNGEKTIEIRHKATKEE